MAGTFSGKDPMKTKRVRSPLRSAGIIKQHDIGVEEMVNEVADETLGYSDDSK